MKLRLIKAIYQKIWQKLTMNVDKKKRDTFDTFESWELTLNAFKSGIFPIKATQGEELNVLTTKPMLQKLPIALA